MLRIISSAVIKSSIDRCLINHTEGMSFSLEMIIPVHYKSSLGESLLKHESVKRSCWIYT